MTGRRTGCDAVRHVAVTRSLAGCLLVAAALGGCGDDAGRASTATTSTTTSTSTSTSTTTTTVAPDPPYLNYVAFARPGIAGVDVATSAGGPLLATVANPNEHGVNTVFLVVHDEPAVALADGTVWHHVFLPIKPNGSTGWVSEAQVELQTNTVKLIIDRANHVLVLERDGAPVTLYQIAVGKSGTETPAGLYFVKELLVPADPAGAYGPYAYGLSGFAGADLGDRFGDGVIGIHGTNDPSKIGTDVSHGCIRMRNADITALVDAELPLGTPVEITA